MAALALAAAAQDQPKPVRLPYTFTQDQVEVRVPNLEVTPDHKYVLVHAFLRSLTGGPVRVSWSGLFSLLTAQGDHLRPSGDCGVDSGTGMHITTGEFLVDRKPTRVLIYFLLAQGELPVRLEFSDGSVSDRAYSR